jgi:Carbamoyltransferase C-terminus
VPGAVTSGRLRARSAPAEPGAAPRRRRRELVAEARALACPNRRRGLPPVVLNTSLNGPREPMAASATDAMAFFLAHPVDALVVGDALVTRRAARGRGSRAAGAGLPCGSRGPRSIVT